MMTLQEFKVRAMSVPWLRGGRDWSGADCWGIVELYSRECWGLNVGGLRGNCSHLPAGWRNADRSGWRQVAPNTQGAIVFTLFSRGCPSHAGIYLGCGDVLHSNGLESRPALAAVTSLRGFARGEVQWWMPKEIAP